MDSSKSPRTLPRPQVAPRNTSGSRAQRAAEMTRLEFERERLMRDKRTLSGKLDTTDRALARLDLRLARLHELLFLDTSAD